jgi:hypothetical protein
LLAEEQADQAQPDQEQTDHNDQRDGAQQSGADGSDDVEKPDQPPQRGALYFAVGFTVCNYPTGTTRIVNRAASCTKACTQAHEETHAADCAPCCAKAGAAYKAAPSDRAKLDVASKYEDWIDNNRHWFECRAYETTVKCADQTLAAKKCDSGPAPADGICCKRIQDYRHGGEAARVYECNDAKAQLDPCPFS